MGLLRWLKARQLEQRTLSYAERVEYWKLQRMLLVWGVSIYGSIYAQAHLDPTHCGRIFLPNDTGGRPYNGRATKRVVSPGSPTVLVNTWPHPIVLPSLLAEINSPRKLPPHLKHKQLWELKAMRERVLFNLGQESQRVRAGASVVDWYRSHPYHKN
jgi:hypothetical protein